MSSPLRAFTSLKIKLSIVIVAAVAVAATTSTLGLRLGWPIWVRPVVAAAVSLVMIHFLAKGLTSPLRNIDNAARRFGGGDLQARATVSTVDEIGRLATSFNSMAEQLSEAETHRRRFVADAAHELRTPVSGLLATVENMADGVTEPTAQELAKLHQQCRRLSALTSDLLDLSRLEAGALELSLDSVDLLDVARAAADEAMVRHPEAVIEVTGGPQTVDADRRHLRRAVDNLLENAAIHGKTALTPAEIKIGVGPGPQIEVSDNGPGLNGTESDVFAPFRRDSTGTAGTGLGLAISREIVALHHGALEVRDTGTGAAFTITLNGRARGDPG
ncbi:MAG: HAMP domain-containing histidine kinase [Actinomycetia bacterium]|nr:HAMP domain-containing histidine kinase [Actinomycetes bacterium]MCP4959287.1 HAMP domain-containing histidine kinase [Actinomycetes bacterium]